MVRLEKSGNGTQDGEETGGSLEVLEGGTGRRSGGGGSGRAGRGGC